MSVYKIGHYLLIVAGVFITSSLLAGAGVTTNVGWYSAPQLLSRILIIVFSMFGAGTILTWSYRLFFKEK